MVFVAAYFHSTHTCQVVGQELRVKQGKSAGLQSLYRKRRPRPIDFRLSACGAVKFWRI
jgi:hypothetical protein